MVHSVTLVGAGSMGGLHARVVASHPQTELAAIVDQDLDRATALTSEYGGVALPLDADIPQSDAMIIASPTGTHLDWAMRSVDAGRPVLIEKPITDGLDETIQVLDAAAGADVPVTCGFVERFNPVLSEALRISTAPVHLDVVRHSPYVERITTGVASDLLIHDIDLALRLAGESPNRVVATFATADPRSQVDAEDFAETQLTFPSGLVATLSASRIAQRKVRTATFSEVDRTVEADLLRRDLVVYRHVGNALVEQGGGGYRQQTIMEIPVVPAGPEPLAAQLDHFIELISGEADRIDESSSVLAPHRVLAEVRSAAANP